MTNLVDRKIGCYYPVSTITSGAYVDTFPYLEGAVVKRKFDIFSTFLEFDADYPGNPSAPTSRKQHTEVTDAMAAGHDVLIALAPITGYQLASNGSYYPIYAAGTDIQAGTYDTLISNLFNWLLTAANTANVNVYVRFEWEANLGPNVSPYYPGVTGIAASTTGLPTASPLAVFTSNGSSPTLSPSDFKATWAHMATLLKGLTNGSRIKMFYCPGCNDSSAAQAAGNTMLSMLPDPAYVDIVGYDTYNSLGSVWYSALDTLRGPRPSDTTGAFAYDILTAANSTAPIWVGEINSMDVNDPKDTASVASGHSKAQWYTDLFNIGADLPRLTGINFFDAPGTRTTWPFTSSATSLAAFIKGFNFGPDGAQHGTLAPAYVPANGVPVVNPTGLTLPLNYQHSVGDTGKTAFLNALAYWLSQAVNVDASGFPVVNATSDGTVAPLRLSRIDTAAGYIPFIDIVTPGGSNPKNVMRVKASGGTHDAFELREDGRLAWGDGATADPDTLLARAATALLQLTGGLNVSGQLSPNNVLMPNASTPPAPAAGAGVQLYAAADRLMVRNQSGTYSLGPSAFERFGTLVVPYTPEAANTTSSALTSGVLYLVRLYIPNARTISRVGMNIATAGATLTAAQCLAGIWDVNGNLIGSSSDQSTAWTSVGSKNMAITATSGTSLAVEPGYVYVGVLSNGTTGPSVSRSLGLGTFLQTTPGAGLNYSKYSSGLTALPTALTLASSTADSDNKFFTAS